MAVAEADLATEGSEGEAPGKCVAVEGGTVQDSLRWAVGRVDAAW